MRLVTALPLVGALLCPAGASKGQVRDLREDVKELAIRHRTEHYELAGTVSDNRLVEYGRCLEYIYREYAQGFGELLSAAAQGTDQMPKTKPRSGLAEPRPSTSESQERFKVVIFAEQAEYDEFGRSYFAGRAEHTRGLYVPVVKLLLIRDELTSQETYDILFHEAFHQFIDRYIHAAPVWINEGLATYYGTARVTPRGLVFDRPRSDYADVVASVASLGQLIPLGELMTATSESFYRREPVPRTELDRVTLSYAQSYTLVAYMLGDAGGREHLRRYLRDLAKARDPDAAKVVTQTVFPDSLLSALVTEWLHFVNQH